MNEVHFDGFNNLPKASDWNYVVYDGPLVGRWQTRDCNYYPLPNDLTSSTYSVQYSHKGREGNNDKQIMKPKYKVGDKVIPKDSSHTGCGAEEHYRADIQKGKKDVHILITKIDADGNYHYKLVAEGQDVYSCCGCLKDNHLDYYKSNIYSNMTIIEKFKLALLGEPKKSFVKKGITSADGKFTPEGRELYEGWRLSKDEKEFNDDVVSKIEIEEEK